MDLVGTKQKEELIQTDPFISSSQLSLNLKNLIRLDKENGESLEASTGSGSPFTWRSKERSPSPSIHISSPLESQSSAQEFKFLPHDLCFTFLRFSSEAFSRSYTLPSLVLRKKEQVRVLSLLHQIIISKVETSFPVLYVYGSPGTGKTTTVMYAISLLDNSPEMKEHLDANWNSAVSYINAGTLARLEDFLNVFVERVCSTVPTKVAKQIIKDAPLNGFRETLLSLILFHDRHQRYTRLQKHKPLKKTILVIDEIDHLDSLRRSTQSDRVPHKSNTTPGSLFEELCNVLLCPEVKRRIVLIGISNAFNTTFRSPFNVSKANFYSLVFTPYTAMELFDIVKHRLDLARYETVTHFHTKHPTYDISSLAKILNEMTIFSDSQLKIITQKIASQYSDCRQLLDVCRNIIVKRMDQLQDLLSSKCNDSGSETLPEDLDTSYSGTSKCFESPEKKSRTLQRNPYVNSKLNSTLASFPEVNSLVQQMREFSFTDTAALECFEKPMSKCLRLVASLPLQQQILACAICCVAEAQKSKDSVDNSLDLPLLTNQIQVAYKTLCESYHIPLAFQDIFQLFNDGLSGLEHTGLIRLSRTQQDAKKGAYRSMRISKNQIRRLPTDKMKIALTAVRLRFPEHTLRACLIAEKQLFSSLLQHPFQF